MVDLETNRVVDYTRAIPPYFGLEWGTPRGTGRIGAYTHVKKYVRQILEQEEYRCMTHVADLILQLTGMDWETFVELKGLRRGVLGKKMCSAEDMFAFLKRGSGEEDEEHLSVRRGRAAYKRLMSMIDRLFPLAEGEPKVTDCGPTYGVVPAVDDELKKCISEMKDKKFPYSLE